MTKVFASLSRKGNISIITMDDGKANAFSIPMIEAFNGCLNDIPRDSGALIITSRPGIFSGGFDLKTIGSGDPDAGRRMFMVGLTLLADIFSFPRPVVMACNGHAIALGAFMLLAADHRIGVQGDFRVWTNEIRNDLAVPLTLLELARTRIDPSYWHRTIMHSEPYAMQDAISPGFLDEVVPQDRLMDKALAKAQELAKINHPSYAITKDRAQRDVLQKIRSSILSDWDELQKKSQST